MQTLERNRILETYFYMFEELSTYGLWYTFCEPTIVRVPKYSRTNSRKKK